MAKKHTKLLKGGAVLIVGEVVNRLSGLLRNFIVARVIAPEQFGIAAALAMSVSLVEMLSDLGAGRYLTRTHSTDDGQSWMAVAHAIALCRGAINALALFLIAPLIADLMHMTDVTWAFRAVAIVPLFRSLTHNQIWLAQRDLRYKAFVFCQAMPQLLTLALAWPIAHWLGDFRAMLLLLVLNNFLATFLSHIAATVPYRVHFDKEKFLKILTFGLPLLGDGLLMFIVLEGERVVIANVYDKMTLGAYSAAFLLAWTPAAMLGRVGLSLGVPQLASLRNDTASRDAHYRIGVQLMLAPAIGLVILFGFAGPAFITAIYGQKYQVSAALAGWLGLSQAIRILRTFPTVIAIAEGFTLSAMIANIARAGSVGVAWVIARQGHPPWTVLAIGAAGEFLALLISLGINRFVLAISPRSFILPSLSLGAIFALSWWIGQWETLVAMPILLRALLGVAAGGLAALVVLGMIPSARLVLAGFIKYRPAPLPMTNMPHRES